MRTARAGEAVRHLRPGDRVCALASAAFATHVTVPAALASRLPDALSFEAAATIPVAFLTSYYALVWQARLERDEWVLIHGGAGAVGMAAIQIAQARGARVIATAGSQAKRDLLRGLDVAHVLNSALGGFCRRSPGDHRRRRRRRSQQPCRRRDGAQHRLPASVRPFP